MSLPREQQIGNQILTKVDLLIEVINAAGHANSEERAQLFDKGSLLVCELTSLLELIIGPREEYLNEAVRELITQRLPDQRMLHDFTDFFAVLDLMCQQARQNYQQQIFQGKPEVSYEPPLPEDNLRKVFAILFPKIMIVYNYHYKGVSFEYYFPSLKLAVEQVSCEKGQNQVRKEFFCRTDGIRLIQIDESKLNSYSEVLCDLKRRLKRSGLPPIL